MSKVLPDPIIGQYPPEVVAIYRVFKAMACDSIMVWVGLRLEGCERKPDFLVLWRERSVFLVAVAPEGQAEFEDLVGLSLFRVDGSFVNPCHREAERLRGFFREALSGVEEAAEERAITGLVLFPGVSQATLDQIPGGMRPSDVLLLGRESCSAEKLAAILEAEAPPALDELAISYLRSAYTPESVVPAGFSPWGRSDRHLEPALTPLLLDYDQEQWAKSKLVLSPESACLAEQTEAYGGASLVTGVAGSGKSLVLLFRAWTQARLAPAARSLLLTHNRALRNELDSRLEVLGRPANVSWHTFYSWLHDLISQNRDFPKIIQYAERDELIAEAAGKTWGSLTPARIQFLREEFDWMQDRGLVQEESYLQANRAGRGIGLGESGRKMVFATYLNYRRRLAEERLEDWSGVALLAWRLIGSGEIVPPCYDFIYIDEAQFFAPVWFWIIQAALRPKSGRIIMAADPTQGFLKRRQPWSQCGLELRGRSVRLRRSYRSTAQILSFAAEFYRQRLLDEELPDLNLPGAYEMESAPSGQPPVILHLTARQDEAVRVGKEIAACLREGMQPENILVIEAGEKRVVQTLEALRAEVGSEVVKDAREVSARRCVKVCGINAATGLEAPCVFLLGAAELISGESDYQLKEEARAELIRDNTRRLYMAFTRAACHLVITWTGMSQPEWLAAGRRMI